jgi:hypothetical protein
MFREPVKRCIRCDLRKPVNHILLCEECYEKKKNEVHKPRMYFEVQSEELKNYNKRQELRQKRFSKLNKI